MIGAKSMNKGLFMNLEMNSEVTSSAIRLDLSLRWLALEDSFLAHWSGNLGLETRQFWSARHFLGPESTQVRETLNRAIKRVLVVPQDWPAQMVLLLYRREYWGFKTLWIESGFPDQEILLFYLSAHLFRWVLPPLRDDQISILVPTYNRLPMLKRLIVSIQSQTDQNWSLLIGDDASTDGTEQYCQKLEAEDARISYLRKPVNSGFYDTLSGLYAQAETELVMNVSDDDMLMPDCVAATRACFRRYPWIAMSGGGYYLLNVEASKVNLKQYGPYELRPGIPDFQRELQRCGIINPIFGGGMLLRKSVLEQISLDDPNVIGRRRFSCWDWWVVMRIMARYETAYSPEIVAVYNNRMDAAQMTFGQDWGAPFAVMLKQLLLDYWNYFGPDSYPQAILNYFITTILERNLLKSFSDCLKEHQSSEDLDHFLKEQREIWELFRWFQQEVLPRANNRVDHCRINETNVAGLSAGDIPGLRNNQEPHVLQPLIQEILGSLSAAPK